MTDTLHGYNCPVRVGDRVRLRPNGVVWQVCEFRFYDFDALDVLLRNRIGTWWHFICEHEKIEQLEVLT